MINKHATWCQCTLMIWFTFCGAAGFSIQELTLQQDLYWFSLFGFAAIVQFIAAEHAHCYYGPEKWQIAAKNIQFVICGIILGWYVGGQWPIIWHVSGGLMGIVLSMLMDMHPAWIFIIPAVYFKSISFCLLIALQSPMLTIKINKKSFASSEMKWVAAKKSASIFLQAILLWQRRCATRFPMTFRWTPVLIGLFFVGLAVIYVIYMVAPTKVSRNAIIEIPMNTKHSIAFSLNAAEACPKCRQYITSLDMESSFGE